MMRNRFNREAFVSTRKKNHLSQALIAELTDTSIRYVGALERGEKTNPSVDLVSRFSVILGVPVGDLMSVYDKEWKSGADPQQITVSPQFLLSLAQFRIPKAVSDLMIFPDACYFVARDAVSPSSESS